jgi:ABC-type Zn2+ transport system substrate-binding protein/surface adhesin
MALDDWQDAGYVCTKRDFESANGDDEDEEEDEEEEEEKKKEKDEEDEDDDDDDDGAIQRLSRQAGKIRLKRARYDFAPRTLSWINPAIRARVGIAIDEDSAGVFRTIGLASVNGVRA